MNTAGLENIPRGRSINFAKDLSDALKARPPPPQLEFTIYVRQSLRHPDEDAIPMQRNGTYDDTLLRRMDIRSRRVPFIELEVRSEHMVLVAGRMAALRFTGKHVVISYGDHRPRAWVVEATRGHTPNQPLKRIEEIRVFFDTYRAVASPLAMLPMVADSHVYLDYAADDVELARIMWAVPHVEVTRNTQKVVGKRLWNAYSLRRNRRLAATRIQAAYKGHVARKFFKLSKNLAPGGPAYDMARNSFESHRANTRKANQANGSPPTKKRRL
jgi:hypothetical protein